MLFGGGPRLRSLLRLLLRGSESALEVLQPQVVLFGDVMQSRSPFARVFEAHKQGQLGLLEESVLSESVAFRRSLGDGQA